MNLPGLELVIEINREVRDPDDWFPDDPDDYGRVGRALVRALALVRTKSAEFPRPILFAAPHMRLRSPGPKASAKPTSGPLSSPHCGS